MIPGTICLIIGVGLLVFSVFLIHLHRGPDTPVVEVLEARHIFICLVIAGALCLLGGIMLISGAGVEFGWWN